MAYVPNTLDAEGDDQKRLNISGTSAGPAGGAAGIGAGNQPTAPSGSSGGFTNIRDYISANAPGAQRLGGQVAARLDKETNEATQAIDTGLTGTKSTIQQNTNAFDRGALDETIGAGAANAATTKMLSGRYEGPEDLSAYRPGITKEIGEAQQKAELAKTQGGRIELLREIANRPQTTGVTRLNSALLQGNAGAQGLVNEAKGRVAPLEQTLTAAEQQAANAANTARSTNLGVRDQTIGGLNTYLDSEEAAAEQRLVDLRAAEQQKQENIRGYLSNLSQYGRTNAAPGFETSGEVKWKPAIGTPAPGTGTKSSVPGTPGSQFDLMGGYEDAGLTEAAARTLQNSVVANNAAGGAGIDLTAYFTPADLTQLNRSNVLTPEQAQKMSALAELAGRSGYQAQAAVLNNIVDFSNASQAALSNKLIADQAAAAKAAADARAAAAAAQAAQAAQQQQATNSNQWWDTGGGDGGSGASGASGGGGVGSDGSGDGTGSGASSDGSSSDGGGGGTGVGSSADGSGSGSDGSAEGSGGVGDGGGGGGGGGGKIICTMMNDYYGLPYNENKVWIKYAKTHLRKEHEVGYHKVFLPLIAFAKRDGFLNRQVRDALFYIGKHRTIDLQAELAGTYRRPVHKFLRAVIEPTLAFIGKHL